MSDGLVVGLALSPRHGFSKRAVPRLRLLAGLGVEGDAHAGETVKHRSRVRIDPTQPNLRQMHLIHAELLDDLAAAGFEVAPGALGENVLTRGLDLLGLSAGTLVGFGSGALVEITGLRNPCRQIEDFRPGLLAEVLGRDADGRLVRKAGVMGVVRASGDVTVGDALVITRPDGPFRPLERV